MSLYLPRRQISYHQSIRNLIGNWRISVRTRPQEKYCSGPTGPSMFRADLFLQVLSPEPRPRSWRHRCGAMAVTARLVTADDTPVGASSSRSRPPFPGPIHSFSFLRRSVPLTADEAARFPRTACFALRGHLVYAPRRTSHSSVSRGN